MFLATHVNRKETFCIRGQWFLGNSVYSTDTWQYKFEGILKGKMPHFRLTCVPHKRLCVAPIFKHQRVGAKKGKMESYFLISSLVIYLFIHLFFTLSLSCNLPPGGVVMLIVLLE